MCELPCNPRHVAGLEIINHMISQSLLDFQLRLYPCTFELLFYVNRRFISTPMKINKSAPGSSPDCIAGMSHDSNTEHHQHVSLKIASFKVALCLCVDTFAP